MKWRVNSYEFKQVVISLSGTSMAKEKMIEKKNKQTNKQTNKKNSNNNNKKFSRESNPADRHWNSL